MRDLLIEDPRVSFVCSNCGATVLERQINEGSRKYPIINWLADSHSIQDCVQTLNARIEKLEQRLSEGEWKA